MNKNIDSDDNILVEYLNDIQVYDILSWEEEQNLFKRIKNNDNKAKEEIIKHNQRLVISIAKKYFNISNAGFDKIDLISEGNIGLIAAIDNFDEKLGYKFSTYATYWIKSALIKAITEQKNIIRIPYNLSNLWAKISKYRENYYNIHKIYPTNKVIIKNLKITNDDIDLYDELYDKVTNTRSLNEPVLYEDNNTVELMDIIENSDSSFDENILDEISQKEFVKSLKDILNQAINENLFLKRDIDIFYQRFGIDGQSIKTLRQLGKEYNVVKETIRRIEVKTIRYLRTPEIKNKLRAYI